MEITRGKKNKKLLITTIKMKCVVIDSFSDIILLKTSLLGIYNRFSESIDHRCDQHSASMDFDSFDRVNAKGKAVEVAFP